MLSYIDIEAFTTASVRVPKSLSSKALSTHNESLTLSRITIAKTRKHTAKRMVAAAKHSKTHS
jgi:hypothetical protein